MKNSGSLGGELTNKKPVILTLLLVISSALIVGSVIMATHALDPTATDSGTPAATPATTTSDNFTGLPCGHGGMDFGRQGMGGIMGDMGGFGGQNIQVSQDFITNVTNIAENDSDVQNLISQGYNITSIHPIIQSVIDGNGAVTTQATTAIVIMQNGTLQDGNFGFAQITVDLTQAKVTQIVTTTRTVINK